MFLCYSVLGRIKEGSPQVNKTVDILMQAKYIVLKEN